MNRDLELDELFAQDPELAAVAHRLRQARPKPSIDPRFSPQLRAQLMLQASAQLQPRRSRWHRLNLGLAWTGATAGAVAAAAVLISLVTSHPHDQVTFVTASSPLTGQAAVTADLITVSFTQPMNQAAVVSGLRIQPATAVTTSWRGNELQIAPVHHLSPNTPYTLTIGESSARSAGGGVVHGGVHIAFGTAPKPTPTPVAAPAAPPALALTPVGQLGDPSRILFGPGGAVVATHGVATVVPVPAASPTLAPSPGPPPPAAATATPAATPATSPAAGPTAAPTPTPVPTPAPPPASLTIFAPDGKATKLGPAATTAAFAPDGKHLAAAVPNGSGVDIAVAQPDGTAPVVVARSDTLSSDLAWSSPDRLLYVSAGQIQAVTLVGAVTPVTPVPAGAPVLLAPNGLSAIVLPAAGNTSAGFLVDLVSKASRELKGSQALAAYSPDGRQVAWFDGAAITVSPAGQDRPVAVPVDPNAGQLTALAISNDATRVAYSAAATSVAQVPSGRVLARGAGTGPVFSPGGDRLALVVAGPSPAAFSAATAPVPMASAVAPAPASVSPTAASVLDRFVQAQVHGDTGTLLELTGGDQSLVQRTPHGLTRGNITTETTRDDGTVTAMVELIADASPQHPASRAVETLTLEGNGPGGYAVTKAAMTPLAVLPPGPNVVSVQPDGHDPKAIDVGFDSDLATGTVAPAISLRAPDGSAVASTAVYNPDTRTATVTPQIGGTGEAEVVIATTLTDITGAHLSSPFTATFRRG